MKGNKTGKLIAALSLASLLLAGAGVALTSGDLYQTNAVAETTADTTWYDATETEFTITQNAEFLGMVSLLAEDSTAFDGKTVTLGQSIDFDAADGFSQIASFGGTLDGGGYTVWFTPDDAESVDGAGLFNVLTSTATVKNLEVYYGKDLLGLSTVGGVAAVNYGTIEACQVDGWTIEANGEDVGGIVGVNYGTVSNCHMDTVVNNATTSEANAKRTGGIVGYNAEGGIVKNSFNSSNVYANNVTTESGFNATGGVVGYNDEAGTVENCYFFELTHYGFGIVSGKGAGLYQSPGEDPQRARVARVKSGEITYLLNGSKSTGTLAWGQEISVDYVPVLGSEHVVYQVTNCQGGATYSNTESESGLHAYVNGTCTVATADGGICGETYFVELDLAYAYDEESGGYVVQGFVDNEEYNEAVINGYGMTVNVPATYDDGVNGEKTVKAIAQSAFFGENVVEVSFSEGLEEIGERAFYNNAITSLSFPASVKTIGNEAFAYNDITGAIVLPASLETFGVNVFYGTYYISTIYLPNKTTIVYPESFYENNNADKVVFVAPNASVYEHYKDANLAPTDDVFSYEVEVTFNAGIGAVNGEKSVKITALYGQPLVWAKENDVWKEVEFTLPVAETDGYELVGWYTDELGEGEELSSSTIITATTFYAVYECLHEGEYVYTAIDGNEGYHTAKCSVCNETMIEEEACSFVEVDSGEASFTTDGFVKEKCEDCGYEKTEIYTLKYNDRREVMIGGVAMNLVTAKYYVNGENGALGTFHATEPEGGWNAKLEYEEYGDGVIAVLYLDNFRYVAEAMPETIFPAGIAYMPVSEYDYFDFYVYATGENVIEISSTSAAYGLYGGAEMEIYGDDGSLSVRVISESFATGIYSSYDVDFYNIQVDVYAKGELAFGVQSGWGVEFDNASEATVVVETVEGGIAVGISTEGSVNLYAGSTLSVSASGEKGEDQKAKVASVLHGVSADYLYVYEAEVSIVTGDADEAYDDEYANNAGVIAGGVSVEESALTVVLGAGYISSGVTSYGGVYFDEADVEIVVNNAVGAAYGVTVERQFMMMSLVSSDDSDNGIVVNGGTLDVSVAGLTNANGIVAMQMVEDLSRAIVFENTVVNVTVEKHESATEDEQIGGMSPFNPSFTGISGVLFGLYSDDMAMGKYGVSIRSSEVNITSVYIGINAMTYGYFAEGSLYVEESDLTISALVGVYSIAYGELLTGAATTILDSTVTIEYTTGGIGGIVSVGTAKGALLVKNSSLTLIGKDVSVEDESELGAQFGIYVMAAFEYAPTDEYVLKIEDSDVSIVMGSAIGAYGIRVETSAEDDLGVVVWVKDSTVEIASEKETKASSGITVYSGETEDGYYPYAKYAVYFEDSDVVVDVSGGTIENVGVEVYDLGTYDAICVEGGKVGLYAGAVDEDEGGESYALSIGEYEYIAVHEGELEMIGYTAARGYTYWWSDAEAVWMYVNEAATAEGSVLIDFENGDEYDETATYLYERFVACAHEAVEEYTYDETGHWFICLVETCDEIYEKAEHEYDNACDVDCNVCGYERTIEHTGGTATCLERATCTVCGEKYGDLLEHVAGEWVVDKAASCTTSGYRHKVCTSGCGKILEVGEIPQEDHVAGEWIVDNAATCTSDGYRHKQCTECDKWLETEKIPMSGHSFGEWTVVKAATADEAGLEERACACGHKETRVIAEKSELSDGAKVGISIGATFAGTSGLAVGLYFLLKKKFGIL